MKEIKGKDFFKAIENIESLRGMEKYKYFFTDDNTPPIRIFEVAGLYVCLYLIDNKYFVGILRIKNNLNLTTVISTIEYLVDEYKEIWQWCYVINKKSMRFHNLLANSKRFKTQRIIKNGISLILVLK